MPEELPKGDPFDPELFSQDQMQMGHHLYDEDVNPPERIIPHANSQSVKGKEYADLMSKAPDVEIDWDLAFFNPNFSDIVEAQRPPTDTGPGV